MDQLFTERPVWGIQSQRPASILRTLETEENLKMHTVIHVMTSEHSGHYQVVYDRGEIADFTIADNLSELQAWRLASFLNGGAEFEGMADCLMHAPEEN